MAVDGNRSPRVTRVTSIAITAVDAKCDHHFLVKESESTLGGQLGENRNQPTTSSLENKQSIFVIKLKSLYTEQKSYWKAH